MLVGNGLKRVMLGGYPLFKKLQEKYKFWISVVNGCQVNLRDSKSDKLLHKGWKVMTTHKRIAELLDLPCRCPKTVEHAKCEGALTGQTAYYTPEMVKRVVLGMFQEFNHGSLVEEMKGKTHFCSSFGAGAICVCEELQYHGSKQQCGSCLEETFLGKRETALVHGETENRTGDNPKKGNMSDEHVKQQLYRLHAATGHGHVRYMIEALRKRGASERVLNLAKQFVCPICQEKGRVQHKHVATLEPLPPKWSTVSADGGKWIHPVTGEHLEFVLIIDESSRFRTGKILCRGKHKTMNASMFLSYMDEGWCQYFGIPQALRLDPAGAFRSNEVERYCDIHGIYLDFIPGEAHWKLGVCEQAIQGTKELMNKLVNEEPDLPAERALSIALRTFNTREVIRGFTPIQHALGRSPDSMGRCIQTLTGQSIEELIPNQGPEFEENIERMRTAEKAHVEWVAQQRMVRALNSRGNKQHSYHPGDLVYYWRKQLSGQRGSSQQQKQGCYLGPGRILVTETKRDPEGNLFPGSAVWIIRGRRLIKCCVEQLRHATQREQLLEHLSHDESQKAPWTFQRLTEGLGGNEFEDVSQDGGPPTTPEEIPTAPMETDEVGRRIHGKRTEQEVQQLRGQPREAERPTSRRRTGEPDSDDALVTKTPWYDYTMEHSRREADGEVFWAEEYNAIEVEVSMPESNRGWKQFETDIEAYFIGALKRRAVEVNERRLSPEDQQRFKDAKMVEVKNYVAARAFEALPPHLRPPAERAIKMRWLLTWKLKDDGTTKPKARAILLGYQDPEYEERETTSPVMTRQSRQLLLAASGRYKWQVWKGDVTGAFLQGREYPKELYCIPCDEICEAMGLETGAVTRVRRGCYGLVDAPLEWYRSVSLFLDQLGLVKSWSDPCTWLWKPQGKLQGLISGHVDDFLFAGPSNNSDWNALTTKIKEHFKWTDWETKSFVQCGVKVEEQSDGSYHLSQEQYIEKIPEIYVSASRKKQGKEDTTDREKSQLRATLGALSWCAQQIAPHLSAEVGLCLSEVTTSTVETLIKVNRLVHFAKARKDHKMIIHAIPEAIPVGFYTWADAAGQNRREGSSTQGIFVGLGPLSLSQGEVAKVIPISWHSNKIERPCRSPGAAESHAAIAGEDYMYHARFQWGEMHSTEVDIFDSDSIVRKIPGCLISDSRNVYDKLQTSELTIRGAERKTDLNLLCLKHAQRVTNLELRWVHSEAQLGNSLTKGGTKEIDLFYGLSFRWRLVADDEMRSARKRRQQGIGVLQPQQSTTQQQEEQGGNGN